MRIAAKMTRLTLRAEARSDDKTWYEHPTYRFDGDARDNLKEIQQRLRWIAQGDHNHALLYRPYDMDLQVAPYRLGSSREDWEKGG